VKKVTLYVYAVSPNHPGVPLAVVVKYSHGERRTRC
jgi:hypothetical protein